MPLCTKLRPSIFTSFPLSFFTIQSEAVSHISFLLPCQAFTNLEMAAQLSDDAPSKPHLVLTYLNIKGYAEPIRLTLAIGKVWLSPFPFLLLHPGYCSSLSWCIDSFRGPASVIRGSEAHAVCRRASFWTGELRMREETKLTWINYFTSLK